MDLQAANQRYAQNQKEFERMQLDHEVLGLQVRDDG